VKLVVSHGFASSITNIPVEALRPLTNLQHLDLSNNRIRSMSQTSFHFLKSLRVLKLQDNQIEAIHKGTIQVHTKENVLGFLFMKHNATLN
jgi:Leucine-rich repeat (LRR) protein